MVVTCSVLKCNSSCKGKNDGISFFRFPKLRTNMKNKFKMELIQRRQRAWKKAINRKEFTDALTKYSRVCSKHFISGKKAKLVDDLNPDWVPSKNMGYENNNDPQKTKEKVNRYNRLIRRKEKDINIADSVEAFDPAVEDRKMHEKESQTEDYFLEECRKEYWEEKYKLLEAKHNKLKEEHLQLSQKQHSFTTRYLKNNPKMVKYFTGFATFQTLEIIFKDCEAYLPFCLSKMTKFDAFIMMLSKLRLDLPFAYLSYKYGVSQKTISKLFHKSLVVAYRRMNCFVFWPEKIAQVKHTPNAFKKCFGEKRIFIIDCFEIYCERPGKMLARANTSSNYKHHQTIKFLICITAYGSIAFISKGYGGRCSDKYITEQCGILGFIQQDDVIMADRGFLIETSISQRRARLIMPSFKNNRNQLEPLAIENNRQIASLRIHVERVIGTLRSKFLITTNRQPITAISKKFSSEMYFDYILKVSCAIINLNPSTVN